ncbi:hypothetical protein DPMN_047758 [Dreissena polymorpha]|uniref:Uncharacterized protein n=1 Tax=Dreissena polymorpha TaxID=45954 RepID=A0A9D4HZG0_DREPO|nr:hypothetical protein DPMN_047758 [Dreissena polymorpha]
MVSIGEVTTASLLCCVCLLARIGEVTTASLLCCFCLLLLIGEVTTASLLCNLLRSGLPYTRRDQANAHGK